MDSEVGKDKPLDGVSSTAHPGRVRKTPKRRKAQETREEISLELALSALRDGCSLVYVANEYPLVYCKHHVGLAEFQRIIVRPDISDKCEYKVIEPCIPVTSSMDQFLNASRNMDFLE